MAGATEGYILGGFCTCAKVSKTFAYFCLGASVGAAAGGAAGLALVGGGVTGWQLLKRKTTPLPSIDPKVITQQPGSPLIISHAPEVTVVSTKIQGEVGSTNNETVF
ncbi:hypothetical protein [Endozoicomonas sp. ALB091]|uniref:hypothetical protein n=1 Tax=Endozoicomonas sp. ALB091 TaxID=3403073 RepID=UPI003BB71628